MVRNFGSKTFGLSLIPNTKNNHFDLLFSRKDKRNFWVDIRDYEKYKKVLKNIKPEIIFHLAAQPSVIESYKFPIDTFETNIIGTEFAKFSKKSWFSKIICSCYI